MYDMQMQTLNLRQKFYLVRKSHSETSKIGIYVKFWSSPPTFVKLPFRSTKHNLTFSIIPNHFNQSPESVSTLGLVQNCLEHPKSSFKDSDQNIPLSKTIQTSIFKLQSCSINSPVKTKQKPIQKQ